MNRLLFSLMVGLSAAAAIAPACGGEEDGGDPGTTSTGGGGSSGTGGSGTGGTAGTFDPDNPGIHVSLSLGSVLMMGQSIELAVAGFMPAAREDFEPDDTGDVIPIDTCVVTDEQEPPPGCTSDEQCAPEQDCIPSEKDDNGNPIPGTEECTTPREMMDVGPLTLEGFLTGPIDLTYNSGQSGAYTVPGTDGSLNAGTLAFDTTYTFHGNGDAGQGLGSFSGQIALPPALELTSPPLVELGMPGLFGVEANPSQDLSLEWSGATGDGELRINLTGGAGSIDCRVADDGTFAIPAAMVEGVELADMALMNLLTLDRPTEGTVNGEGITFHAIDGLQTLLINVAKVQ